MRLVQFAVIMKDREWTVFRDAVPLRPFLTRSAAIEAAEALAFEAEEQGERVDLVIQDYHGSVAEKRSGGPHEG
jgi:hypothetical protein